MNKKSTTETAVSLLRHGWSVIPVHSPVTGGCSCGLDCSYPGKHPRISWREFTEHRPSEEQVRYWFDDEFYGANLGVVTGKVSDLVVVDLDGDTDAFIALNLPDTAFSRTGGGGLHFFYRMAGKSASSGVGVTPGIDVKAEGGFVVLPPSIHASGFRYEWIEFRRPTLIRPSQLPKRVEHNGAGFNGQWYGELLRGVSEGDRFVAVARLAGRYASLGLTMDEALLLLVSWNAQNSPPLPLNELGRSVSAVYRKEELRKREENITDLADLVDVLTKKVYREDINP